MSMKKIVGAVTVVVGLSVSAGAIAADGAKLYKRKGCFACHGKDANSPILPIYPRLAGQNADYAFNQMKDIFSGARTNKYAAGMKDLMVSRKMTEEQMRAIVDWLATL